MELRSMIKRMGGKISWWLERRVFNSDGIEMEQVVKEGVFSSRRRMYIHYA